METFRGGWLELTFRVFVTDFGEKTQDVRITHNLGSHVKDLANKQTQLEVKDLGSRPVIHYITLGK